MKATHVTSNTIPSSDNIPGTVIPGTGETASGSSNRDQAIDRALRLLGEVFDFEIVDRCAASCTFCDDGLPRAA